MKVVLMGYGSTLGSSTVYINDNAYKFHLEKTKEHPLRGTPHDSILKAFSLAMPLI